MVTQELLIFLGLFISTEPQLFEGMIRLRLGLIIQVMISELEITLSCSGSNLQKIFSQYISQKFLLKYHFFIVEEATDHLLNLSPFEMKTLLHMVLSGKELGAQPSNFTKYSTL